MSKHRDYLDYGGYRIAAMNSGRITSNELNTLSKLYNACLGEKAVTNTFIRHMISGNLSPWVWRNVSSPNQYSNTMALAFKGEEVVGHVSYVALKGSYDGEEVLCGFGQDNMVHPDHRNEGLYAKMLEFLKLYTHENTDIRITYGFPNKINPLSKSDSARSNQFRTFLEDERLDQRLGNVVFLERKVHVSGKPEEAIESMYDTGSYYNGNLVYHGKTRMLSSFGLINGLDELLDEHNKSTREISSFSLWKDIAYLDWRYIMNPANASDYSFIFVGKDAGIEGFAVVKRYINNGFVSGHVLDIIARDRPSYLKVLFESEKYLADNEATHCSLVQTFLPNGEAFPEAQGHQEGYEYSKNLKFSIIIESLSKNITLEGLAGKPISISAGDIDVF